MIAGKTDLKFIAGSEGCFRITVTDASCPNPVIAGVNINGDKTSAADINNQNLTDGIGVEYIGDPFVVNTQGLPTLIEVDNPLDPSGLTKYTWTYI